MHIISDDELFLMEQTSPNQMSFPLGKKTLEDTKKSLESLIAHEIKQGNSGHEFVYLVINTERPFTKVRDHTPRIVPIPNRLSRISERSVLLITKDPSTPYRDPLTRAKSPTEDLFKDIMPLKKVKTLTRSTKSAKNMLSEYDLILADHRIHHLLPDIMGEVFYRAHKRVPFVVQLAQISEEDMKKPLKRQERVERCDAQYVLKQMRSIAKNTYYFPSRDAQIVLKVGYIDTEPEKLCQNIGAVIEFLHNEKFLPSGGVLKKNPMKELFVKTNNSASLPIWVKKD